MIDKPTTGKYQISFFIDTFVTTFTNLYNKAAAKEENILRGSSFLVVKNTRYMKLQNISKRHETFLF